MKYLALVLLTFCSTLFLAFQPSKALNTFKKKTRDDLMLASYIDAFPFQEYQIFQVENFASFYVDDVPDGIKWHLRNGIYWESTIGMLIRMLTKPNSVAIDLGAHIGIHTITMSRKVGLEGFVVAIEPQLKIFRELHHNLQLNQCDHNVIALRNAAGDSNQLTEMSPCDPTNEGGTAIGTGGDPVYMVTLDSLNLSHVSLIKIDVESHELMILKGARETLLRNKPTIILEILGNHDLDTCTGEIREQYDQTIQFLTSLGYRVERIFGNDFLALPE